MDEKGKRVGVLLDPKVYQRLLAALEELESIRAYDAEKNRAKKRFHLNKPLSRSSAGGNELQFSTSGIGATGTDKRAY